MREIHTASHSITRPNRQKPSLAGHSGPPLKFCCANAGLASYANFRKKALGDPATSAAPGGIGRGSRTASTRLLLPTPSYSLMRVHGKR